MASSTLANSFSKRNSPFTKSATFRLKNQPVNLAIYLHPSIESYVGWIPYIMKWLHVEHINWICASCISFFLEYGCIGMSCPCPSVDDGKQKKDKWIMRPTFQAMILGFKVYSKLFFFQQFSQEIWSLTTRVNFASSTMLLYIKVCISRYSLVYFTCSLL